MVREALSYAIDRGKLKAVLALAEDQRGGNWSLLVRTGVIIVALLAILGMHLVVSGVESDHDVIPSLFDSASMLSDWPRGRAVHHGSPLCPSTGLL